MAWRGAGVVSDEAPAFRSGAAAGRRFSAAGVEALIAAVQRDPRYAREAGAVAVAAQTYAARRGPYQRAADAVEAAVGEAAAGALEAAFAADRPGDGARGARGPASALRGEL